MSIFENSHLPFVFSIISITADLVTFTEDIFDGKLHVLCSVNFGELDSLFLKDRKYKPL